MLIALSDPAKIERAQKRLELVLRKSLRMMPGRYTLGHQGNNIPADDLRANGRIWHFHRRIRDTTPRHWNAFGLSANLSSHGSNAITVEVNVAFRDLPRRVAGLFAIDTSTNAILLLHRGKIGGGRKGIGKSEFLKSYLGRRVSFQTAQDSVVSEEAILVADTSFISLMAIFLDWQNAL